MAKSQNRQVDKVERRARVANQLERAVRQSDQMQRLNRMGARNWQNVSDDDADEIVEQAQRWLANRR